MLNQNSTIPLYEQVKESIKQKIEQKEWKENTKVPSETELMKRYEVSRVTVRNALALLVEEGYLEKKQGIGTFVSRPRIKKIIFHRSSFTQSCEKGGLKPSAQVLKKEVIDGKNLYRKSLQLAQDDKLVHIERLRMADDEPVSLEHMYFSYQEYGFLLWEDLEGSVYAIMKKRLGIDLTEKNRENRNILSVEKAGARFGKLFGVSSSEPVFVMETLVYHGGKPVYAGKDYCLGSRFCYEVNSTDVE
ncbi:MAG: GntR family transcriptional regulator [Eubacteriales bacterium]|nr:GntR family transcriptional regulator [Eubacteriales bacterium]